jgi:hypothetical protein
MPSQCCCAYIPLEKVHRVSGKLRDIRKFTNEFNFLSPQLANLPHIKVFPGIRLDQSDTLQCLCYHPYTLICDLDPFLTLNEHKSHEVDLDWEPKDKNLTPNRDWVVIVSGKCYRTKRKYTDPKPDEGRIPQLFKFLNWVRKSRQNYARFPREVQYQ